MNNKALLLAFLTTCSCAKAPNAAEVAKAHAKSISDEYIARRSPKMIYRTTSVTEEGNAWIVTYHIPKGYTGGDFSVLVDKRTMKVSGAVGSQ